MKDRIIEALMYLVLALAISLLFWAFMGVKMGLTIGRTYVPGWGWL